MVDIPEKWQLKQLHDVIDASPLAEDGFRSRPLNRGGAINTKAQVTHEGYPKAEFIFEWMDLRDPTGYSGRSAGDWHVEMRPGRDGPVEKSHYIPWERVVEHFERWLSYLAREFEAGDDWGHFVRLPRLPAPAPVGDEQLSEEELKVIEPLLLDAEAEFLQVVEAEFAWRQDLDELREWVQSEFDDVRAELRKQSRRGVRRTLFGMGANLAIRFGPKAWREMVPFLERLIRVLDGFPTLPGS